MGVKMKKLFFNKDNNTASKKGKIIKISVIIILAIMIISMCIFYEKNDNVRKFFDKYVFMKNVYENDLPQIENSAKAVFAYKDSLLIFKDNQLISYNKYGKEEYKLNVELVNPIFESCDDYILIAEKGGGRIYVIARKNIIWQDNLKGEISGASINKNGYCSVTIFGTTDKSVVKVFNNEGEELFSKHIAEDYVIDADISPDNQYLAIAKVNYSGIDVKSTIETIEIKEAKVGKSVINEYKTDLGDLVINIQYDSKNNLVCMYDKYINIIKSSGTEKKVDFNQENILFADINNKIIKVVKINDGVLNSRIELQMLDTESDKTVTYEIEEPKAIYVNSDRIAVNFGSEALFISNNGWLIKEYTSSQEINKIVISDNIAGIIYKNKIEIISL